MNQDAAVLLMLLCMIAAWAWAWRVIATRRTARGNNRFIAHLIGALAGSGAAFGAFCLSGAFLMPGTGDGVSMAIGVFGTLILCAYLGVLHPPKKTVSPSAQAEPAGLATTAVTEIDDSPGMPHVPRKPVKESIQTWWKVEKRKRDELLRQEERKRVGREKALGMSLGTFFSERMEDHLMLWCGVLFIVVWGSLFVFVPSAEDWLTQLVVSFIVTCLLAAIWGVLCILIVPAILLLLVLLPFVCVSVFVEAWWRIRHNQPYVAPPVVIIPYSEITPPAPRQNSHNWLIPLAIGLWIGNSWGNDD